MAKNFKGNNPLNKMDSKKTAQAETEEMKITESNSAPTEVSSEMDTEPAAESTGTPTIKPTKKKTGRPKIKEGEYKTINISVPVPVLEKMEVAKLKYGNNLTAYVNAVIKADLAANYEKYLQLQEIMNS